MEAKQLSEKHGRSLERFMPVRANIDNSQWDSNSFFTYQNERPRIFVQERKPRKFVNLKMGPKPDLQTYLPMLRQEPKQ